LSLHDALPISEMITFFIWCLRIKSVQGGVLPWIQHGSRLTYSVDSEIRATSLGDTEATAFTSAWCDPYFSWNPSPIIRSLCTNTAPTRGFLLVWRPAFWARSKHLWMYSSSSMVDGVDRNDLF